MANIGGGYSFSNNYNEDGLYFSASIGHSILQYNAHYDAEEEDQEKDDLPLYIMMNTFFISMEDK